MSIKGNDVVGLDVITLDDGRKHGKIKQLLYDTQGHEVKALLMDGKGMFSGDRALLIPNIRSIGKDAVTIESASSIKELSDVEEHISYAAYNDYYLTKTKIITKSGTDLGQVRDIYFEPSTGKVIELEVSQGIFENAKSGLKRVRVEDITTIGKDATVVKTFIEGDMEQQAETSGLQGAINTGKQRMPEIIANAKSKTKGMVDSAKKSVLDIKEDPEIQDKIATTKSKVVDAKERFRQASESTKQEIENKDKDQLIEDTSKKIGRAVGDISRRTQEVVGQVQENMVQGYQSAKGGSASSDERSRSEDMENYPRTLNDRNIKKTVYKKN